MRSEYRSKWRTPTAMLVEMVAETNQWRKWRKQDATLLYKLCTLDAALVHWLWWVDCQEQPQPNQEGLPPGSCLAVMFICPPVMDSHNMYQHVMYWRCLKNFEAYALMNANWNVMRLFKLLPWMFHVWQNADLHPLPIAGFTIPSLVTGATWPSATAVSGQVDLA